MRRYFYLEMVKEKRQSQKDLQVILVGSQNKRLKEMKQQVKWTVIPHRGKFD